MTLEPVTIVGIELDTVNAVRIAAVTPMAMSMIARRKRFLLLDILEGKVSTDCFLLRAEKKGLLIFLILEWSALHAKTQNVFAAFYGVGLVLIIYTPYEHAKSPLTLIIICFASLVG